jgi:hypothetical protein
MLLLRSTSEFELEGSTIRLNTLPHCNMLLLRSTSEFELEGSTTKAKAPFPTATF